MQINYNKAKRFFQTREDQYRQEVIVDIDIEDPIPLPSNYINLKDHFIKPEYIDKQVTVRAIAVNHPSFKPPKIDGPGSEFQIRQYIEKHTKLYLLSILSAYYGVKCISR